MHTTDREGETGLGRPTAEVLHVSINRRTLDPSRDESSNPTAFDAVLIFGRIDGKSHLRLRALSRAGFASRFTSRHFER